MTTRKKYDPRIKGGVVSPWVVDSTYKSLSPNNKYAKVVIGRERPEPDEDGITVYDDEPTVPSAFLDVTGSNARSIESRDIDSSGLILLDDYDFLIVVSGASYEIPIVFPRGYTCPRRIYGIKVTDVTNRIYAYIDDFDSAGEQESWMELGEIEGADESGELEFAEEGTYWFQSDGVDWVNIGGGSASSTEFGTIKVHQVAHGFVVGDAVKKQSGNSSGVTDDWIKAQADSKENAAAIAVVCHITGTDDFICRYAGIMYEGDWTDGMNYFLSPDTAGLLVEDEPTYTIGQVREFIGTGVTTTKGTGLLIDIDLGDVIQGEEEITFYAEETSEGADLVHSEGSTAMYIPLVVGPGIGITVDSSGNVIFAYVNPIDISFEYKDITRGFAQSYTLDINATFAYEILGFAAETDTGQLTGVHITINDVDVTGMSSITVTEDVTYAYPSANYSVAIGDRVMLKTTTGYAGYPLTLTGKIWIQLV